MNLLVINFLSKIATLSVEFPISTTKFNLFVFKSKNKEDLFNDFLLL